MCLCFQADQRGDLELRLKYEASLLNPDLAVCNLNKKKHEEIKLMLSVIIINIYYQLTNTISIRAQIWLLSLIKKQLCLYIKTCT